MSSNQNVPARVATVKLTRALLNEAPSLSEMLSIPAIEERWVDTYEKISGKPDGALRFEAEKILFSQAIANNKALEECDRFTLYGSFIELAISGLSLRDGLSYIIPFGKKASWFPGWKGRLEQINENRNVIHIQQPQVVYDCDHFDYEKGMKTVIHSHKPASPRPKDAVILHVYLVIQFTHGLEVYMMDREDVLSIRNNYSQSYKSYAKALEQPQNKGRKFGDKLLIKFKDKSTGSWKEFESDELPMWVSDEAQGFKKTLVKRVYNELPKLPKHKALDDKLASFMKEESGIDNGSHSDPEDVVSYEDASNFLAVDEEVDEDTGEITKHEDVKDPEPEPSEDEVKKAAAKEAAAKKAKAERNKKAAEKKKAEVIEEAEIVDEPEVSSIDLDADDIPEEEGF